ncbi:MAG: conjugal transfer protein TraD [Pseudomonadota bacterium]|nr:conjugal transfer protein TraD [Pseudomonadota bacterium]
MQKAELIELTNDDRAVLFGEFLPVAARLRSEEHEQTSIVWCRQG